MRRELIDGSYHDRRPSPRDPQVHIQIIPSLVCMFRQAGDSTDVLQTHSSQKHVKHKVRPTLSRSPNLPSFVRSLNIHVFLKSLHRRTPARLSNLVSAIKNCIGVHGLKPALSTLSRSLRCLPVNLLTHSLRLRTIE